MVFVNQDAVNQRHQHTAVQLFDAVSYTHLDVYKRQEDGYAIQVIFAFVNLFTSSTQALSSGENSAGAYNMMENSTGSSDCEPPLGAEDETTVPEDELPPLQAVKHPANRTAHKTIARHFFISSLPFSVFYFHPFTAPNMIPFMKYRCRNG